MDFDTQFRSRKWTPLRNCPGRFRLAEGVVAESPSSLAPGTNVKEFRVVSAKDVVVVAPFETGGGLISYKRSDGKYLHTLNTSEGFARKLSQLGIQLP